MPSPHLFPVYFAILVRQVFFTFVKTSIVCSLLVPVMDHPLTKRFCLSGHYLGKLCHPLFHFHFPLIKNVLPIRSKTRGRLANVPQSYCGTDKKNRVKRQRVPLPRQVRHSHQIRVHCHVEKKKRRPFKRLRRLAFEHGSTSKRERSRDVSACDARHVSGWHETSSVKRTNLATKSSSSRVVGQACHIPGCGNVQVRNSAGVSATAA